MTVEILVAAASAMAEALNNGALVSEKMIADEVLTTLMIRFEDLTPADAERAVEFAMSLATIGTRTAQRAIVVKAVLA